jgi:hypothetical protein
LTTFEAASELEEGMLPFVSTMSTEKSEEGRSEPKWEKRRCSATE